MGLGPAADNNSTSVLNINNKTLILFKKLSYHSPKTEMPTLFFLIALVFSMPFLFSAESDDTDWKPLESLPRGAFHSWFTKNQIQRANEYFLTLNDTEKLNLFGNWSGIVLGNFSTEIDQ